MSYLGKNVNLHLYTGAPTHLRRPAGDPRPPV